MDVTSLNQELIDASNAVYLDGPQTVGNLTPLTVNGQLVFSSKPADGFYATAYIDSQSNIIIAYRGTTSLSTLLGADVDLANGERIPALQDAVDFANLVHSIVGSTASIYVTGHSLGGAEAAAAASNLNFISGGVTFGAPGLPAAALGPVSPTNFVNYVEYLDPVGNEANDSFNPLYSFTTAPRMGAHYGSVIYKGSLGTHVIADIPGIGFATSVASLTDQLGFHSLDVYAGDLGLALNIPVVISKAQETFIYSNSVSTIIQQVDAHSAPPVPTSASYPIVTGPVTASTNTNTNIPLSSLFVGSEAPANSGHHIDHYTAFIVAGIGNLIVNSQSYSLGNPATNISPAQFATATFSSGANPGATEIAVVAFDDLGNSSVAADTIVTVTTPPTAPQPIVSSDHTPPILVAPSQQLVTGVGSNPDLTQTYLQVTDANSAHYTPAQLTYTITSAPSHGYVIKGGSIVSTFTQADINNHLVEYQENGTVASSDSFTYFVSDPAGNKTPNTTFNISINAPATSTHPTLTTNTALSVGQAQTALITDSNLFVADASLNPWQIIYMVTGGPAHGQILADGVNVVTSFTQQQVDLGLVSYSNTGNQSGPDNLSFTVSDSAGGTIGQTTFGINVIPNTNLHVTVERPLYNDPQANTVPGNGNFIPWDVSTLSPAIFTAADQGVDPSNIVYTITNMPAGTFFLIGQFGPGSAFTGYSSFSGRSFGESDIENGFPHSFTQAELASGQVYFRNIEGSSSSTTYGAQYPIIFSVSDNTGNTSSNLTLPLVIQNGGMLSGGVLTPLGNIAQTYVSDSIGQVTNLGSGLLTYVAPQSQSSQAIYHTFFLPSHGSLLLNGHAIAVGTDFTQQDIDQGGLSYSEDGSLVASDQFGFILYDPFHSGGSPVYVNVTMTGTQGGQVLAGSTGSEILSPGTGSNHLFGDGSTTVNYANSPNGVTVDLVHDTASNGYGGIDTITNIHAVIGSSHDDTLIGGPGNDVLNGNTGTDTLIGGHGADAFVFDFAALTDAQAATPVIDHITDYDQGNTGNFDITEGDQIDLSALLATAYNHGSGEAVSSLVRAIEDPSGAFAHLQIDSDGTANGANWTTIALLDGVHSGSIFNVILDPTLSGGAAVATSTFFAQPSETLAAFNPANGWTSQDQFPRELADVNGDGSADIVAFGNGGVYVSLATGGGNFAASAVTLSAFNPANGWTSDNAFHRELADVNHDGLADIVGFGNSGVYVSLATGGGHFATPAVTLAAFNPMNGWTSQDQFPRELADVNGDGMADIVAFGNGGVYVSLATGGGHFAAPAVTLAAFNPANGWTSQDQFPRELADVNGDGMADIVAFGNGGVYVSLATGGGNFAAPIIGVAALNPANGWTSNHQYLRELADVNHDGMADVVGFGNGGVYVALATGGGHFAAPIVEIAAFNPANGWTGDDQFHRALADVNHDGFADIVGFGNPGVLVSHASDFHLI
jgi:hypothetical protein